MFSIGYFMANLLNQAGVRFNKLQKILLIGLCFEFVLVGMFNLGRMVGQQFLWYTVEPWMLVSEGICSALALPQVAVAIWNTKE